MSIKLETEDLEPLKIKCITALCDRDLHCFLRTRKVAQKTGGGPCRKCKKNIVDFARIAARNIADTDYTFDRLQKETIRAKFWRKPIAADLIAKARATGRAGLRAEAAHILTKVVGPKPKGTPWDSQGTKFDGNVLFFAQHATACCCRRCAQEWHGIPDDRALTPTELNYMVELVMRYVERRISDLPESGDNHGRGAA
jgi:hypothetical protein